MRRSRWLPFLALGLVLGFAAPASARPATVPRLEVAFVLDVTGSMGPWIAQARQRILEIAEDLASGDPAPDIRFGLVTYRDRGDDYVYQVHALTADLGEIKRELDGAEARGGGDTPEAVLEALHGAVVELGWSDADPSVVRLVYLVGDAPATHHPDTPDDDLVLADALDRGIVIHTIACGSIGAEGEAFFERVARLSEGRPFRLLDASGPLARRAAGLADAGVSAAGAARATSLAAAVSGPARAHSGSVGVAYAAKARPPVPTAPLAAPIVAAPTAGAGLLGAHLRVVADARTWSDLWLAFTSTAAGAAPAPPEIDFERTWVLVLGGADAGLDLVRLEQDDGVRLALVRPAAAPGVRFLTLAAGDPIVAVAAPAAQGGAR